MKNFITDLRIQNFKSIKDLELKPKRINIFIGHPNVGKSNILEALSLYSEHYERDRGKYLSSFLRYNKIPNLFYDNQVKEEIKIDSNLGSKVLTGRYSFTDTYLLISGPRSTLKYIKFPFGSIQDFLDELRTLTEDIDPEIIKDSEKVTVTHIGSSGEVRNNESIFPSHPVKKYDFKKTDFPDDRFSMFLRPPFGENIYTVIESHKELHSQIAELFTQYGLKLVLRTENNSLEIQKEIEGRVYIIPYSSIADTLQRIIFYLAAIQSNENSVLLFEEPEAHSFPPYTDLLAENIYQSESNQFFITTHSPYLLTTLLEKDNDKEVGVYVAYYENYETKIKALNPAEIQEIYEAGMSAFYNLDKYIPENA